MLSTMTTSENFPLCRQSECSRSPYESTIQSTYIASLLPKNTQFVTERDHVPCCRLFKGTNFHHEKMAPSFCYRSSSSKEEDFDFLNVPSEMIDENEKKEIDPLCKDVSRTKFENELSDILEQLETDDSSCDQSKPLKIDPNVLKLDFSKLSDGIKQDGGLDKLCLIDLFEMKRASHHLSGGGLLTDGSLENYRNSSKESSNNKLCKFTGVDAVTTKEVFNFEKLKNFDVGSNGAAQFLNQISPSSPLSFDLTMQREQSNKVTSGISSEVECTNPFKNFVKGVLEVEKCFSPTNPFNDVYNSSSPYENSSIIFVPPRYENISLPQKSFSQCSTRSASPVLKAPEEPSTSNPFLLNDSSPEQCSSAAPKFFSNDPKYPENPLNPLPNPSSFILAVPVFPIFQHNITNSSTQTVDLSERLPKPEEPVYQNVTNQLRKFIKTNDHSEYDLQCLKTTVKDLRNSGWYYENVSWQESAALLTDTEPGTFLIRDSSDPKFLFSLSVQTSRGPTSVRLHYVNGQFRLDAEQKLIPHMPSFNSVIELIDYYVENTVQNKSNNGTKSLKKLSKNKLQKSKDQVWIDSEGKIYSNILLIKPLCKREHFSTLQHLVRLTINRLIRQKLNAKVKFDFRVTPVYESYPFQDSSFQNNFDNFCPILYLDTLPLPSKLLEYLKEYPFCH